MSALMFIRFASGEVDPTMLVRPGLFRALTEIDCEGDLPDYERDALREIEKWFDENLPFPPDELRCAEAVCWFKATARQHLSRAWEMAEILERNDVLVWTIRSKDVGDIYYEDETQVVARPTHKVRRLLRR